MAIEAIRNPEKTEDDVIAGLRVNGLVDNPVVEVFSTPSKPQANALSYLLLGRDMNSSGGDKSMTTGLIGLGIATSGNLVGQIGNAFGLRELSLDTAGSGNNSKVTVSGYLSPRLQVKYGVGIFDQFGEFTLRYRLMRKLYLEAVRGLNSSVDVLYKVDSINDNGANNFRHIAPHQTSQHRVMAGPVFVIINVDNGLTKHKAPVSYNVIPLSSNKSNCVCCWLRSRKIIMKTTHSGFTQLL